MLEIRRECYRQPPHGGHEFDWLTGRSAILTHGRQYAHFEATAHAVILCTGYKHALPFLPDDLRLKPPTVWQQQISCKASHRERPDLFTIRNAGPMDAFSMFDAQAWWARVIWGALRS
jgi:trimethylamine monooxygenase